MVSYLEFHGWVPAEGLLGTNVGNIRLEAVRHVNHRHIIGLQACTLGGFCPPPLQGTVVSQLELAVEYSS